MLPRRLASGCSHALAIVLGLAFCRIGLLHWTNPEPFEAIVPAYLGAPSFWNLLSGSFEILFGIGLVMPRTRKRAAMLLFFLVIAMSLANVNMWVNDLPFNGTRALHPRACDPVVCSDCVAPHAGQDGAIPNLFSRA